MSPCADEREARVSRSVLSCVVSSRSDASVVSASLPSGRGAPALAAATGVLARVRGFGREGCVVGGDVRKAVGFWSRPLHTCVGDLIV